MPDNSEQLSSGVSFAPTNPLDQTKLGVFAPLDVEGARSQASYLANSLGVAAEHLQRPLMYAEEAEGSAKAKAQSDQGATDALSNNVNPDTWNEQTAAYQNAAVRTSAEASTTKALQQADQLRSTPVAQGGWFGLPINDTQGADGTTKPGLMSTMDNYFKQQLGGLETDPTVAPIIHPLVQHFYNETAGAAIQKQQQDLVSTAISNQQALALHSFTTADPSYNFQTGFSTLTKLGLSNTEASAAMVHALGEAAVQAHNPSLIDHYMPAGSDIPGGVSPADVPANAAYLLQARARATAAQVQFNKVQAQGAESNLMQAALSGKDPTPLLRSYVAMPGADASFAMHFHDWYQDMGRNTSQAQLDSAPAATITAGIARGDITTTPQLFTAIQRLGLSPDATTQLLTKGMSTLKAVQSSGDSDPFGKAMQSDLDQLYKPVTDGLGNFQHPAALAQHAGVMLDYRMEYQKAVQGGASAPLAAQQAYDTVRQKYGDPIDTRNIGQSATPRSEAEQTYFQVRAVKSANAKALATSGVSGEALKSLMDQGLVSAAEANAAATAIIQNRYKR